MGYVEGWFSDPTKCTPELLQKIMESARQLDGNYARMKDQTLVTSLISEKGGMGKILRLQGWPGSFLLACVQDHGYDLQHVTRNLRTPEICLAAVLQWPAALRYVPRALRTKEICEAALRPGASNDVRPDFTDVPKEFWTEEVILTQLENHRLDPKKIPDLLRTPKVLDFVAQKAISADSLRPEEWTPERVELALQTVNREKNSHQWHPLLLAPKERQTKEAWLAEVRIRPQWLFFVPKELQDGEMLQAAAETALKDGSFSEELLKALPPTLQQKCLRHPNWPDWLMRVVKPDAETLLHRFSNAPNINEQVLQNLPQGIKEKARETIIAELKKLVEKEE